MISTAITVVVQAIAYNLVFVIFVVVVVLDVIPVMILIVMIIFNTPEWPIEDTS
jgi:hypothetical protein